MPQDKPKNDFSGLQDLLGLYENPNQVEVKSVKLIRYKTFQLVADVEYLDPETGEIVEKAIKLGVIN